MTGSGVGEEGLPLGSLLAQAPVISVLDAASRSELTLQALRMEHEKGEFIFQQGEAWPCALYLATGKLEWSILSPDGKCQALFDPVPGSVFWGHSLFDDQPMPGCLVALEPSLCFRWSRETLRPVLLRNPDALWALAQALVGTMRRARELIYGFAFQSVSGRVARLLLMHYPIEEGRAVRRSMTLEGMAAHVGSTPALVCKSLYGLADRGLIRLTRTELEFIDRAGLILVAQQGEAYPRE